VVVVVDSSSPLPTATATATATPPPLPPGPGSGLVVDVVDNGYLPAVLVVVGCTALVAGWFSSTRGLSLHAVLYPEGAILAALGLYRIFRRFTHTPQAD